MRIFYDVTARNIDFEGLGRYFSSGSMEAIPDGNNVIAQYKDSNVKEIYEHFSTIQKEDGSPAGASVTEVVDYLNEEFNKGIIKGLSSFDLLSSVKVVEDSRLRVGNVIGITEYGGTGTEKVWTDVVTTIGQFTAHRRVLNGLLNFTNNLSFQWERIE